MCVNPPQDEILFFGLSLDIRNFSYRVRIKEYLPAKSIACELIVVNEQFEIEISFAIVKAQNVCDGKTDRNVVFFIVKWSIRNLLSACLSMELISVFSNEML